MSESPVPKPHTVLEERGQGAVGHRAGAAVDFDVEHACGWIGTNVRLRNEQIRQQPPGGGVVDVGAAHQGAEGGFGAVGDHVHGIQKPLASEQGSFEPVWLVELRPIDGVLDFFLAGLDVFELPSR